MYLLLLSIASSPEYSVNSRFVLIFIIKFMKMGFGTVKINLFLIIRCVFYYMYLSIF